jgi:Fur family ferric uptake transcriptional regulator
MERNTIQRRAIHKVLEDSGRPMGPNEIFNDARVIAPGLGIATVYRTIKRLVDEGWLVPVELPGEAPRYERSGQEHHHHFRCNACDRVYDMEGCPPSLKSLTPRGFQLESHEVVLYGRCASCANSSA